MDWIQVFTIIGVLGGFMFFMLQRLERDIERIDIRMDGHASRIDQLYQMFVSLLKEKK